MHAIPIMYSGFFLQGRFSLVGGAIPHQIFMSPPNTSKKSVSTRIPPPPSIFENNWEGIPLNFEKK